MIWICEKETTSAAELAKGEGIGNRNLSTHYIVVPSPCQLLNITTKLF